MLKVDFKERKIYLSGNVKVLELDDILKKLSSIEEDFYDMWTVVPENEVYWYYPYQYPQYTPPITYYNFPNTGINTESC